jgi:phosphohistidine phosphatase
MRLYLVQHGEAKSEEDDPKRPLADQGRLDVERMGKFLKRAGLNVSKVVHSGKLRARQTAEILASAIAPKASLETSDIIKPNDEPGPFAENLEELNEDTMIVGHLPFMSRLVSILINGTSELIVTLFQPGSVVCLERSEQGGWALCWMIRPELIRV